MSVTLLGVHAGRVPAGTEALLDAARVVAGPAAVLDALAPAAAARHATDDGGLPAALDAICASPAAIVLASGDPGFFGVAGLLARRLPAGALAVHPAPTSAAVAFGRLGVPWQDARVVSGHGRDPRPALATALRHRKVAVLTDPAAPPSLYLRALDAARAGVRCAIATALGTPRETVRSGTPAELLALGDPSQPNLLLVLDDGEEPARGAGWALPEDAFAHRDGMVTKAPVRALALAALGPRDGRLVWDVGCGSGSVAVECARLGAATCAVDRDPAAVALTRENADTHGVVVDARAGTAPAVLAALPEPDAVFVGGGGPEVVDACAAHARDTVVVALALIERAAPTLERLRAHGFTADATMLGAQRLRAIADGHRLAPDNPVIVVSGRRA